ncbi:YafY family protein [Caldilinea sp.]|uniref:helix-turn-helix transcriptional regulator n=2 Tax=Caldilinea sp. TaxID=2293560 RepID=UPI0021DBCEF2|nr:WYL domain-containing protein [Caldilinea sp.]GIV71279.1 MAG: transcriptional regulator [Caldilinea sp.]
MCAQLFDQFEDSGAKPEEIKRTARILAIVLLITTFPKKYHRKDLVERFEISPRMIDKDLEIIRHGLKLPLRKDRNGYYFERTPELPMLRLGFAEALALLIAVQSAKGVSGLGGPELASAVARLESLFPDEYVVMLRQLAKPVPLSSHYQQRQKMLTLLTKAHIEKRKLRILYETASRNGEISERVVCPYALVPYVRSWQLVAYCEKRRNVLMFKVDRILEAVILDSSYEIPADFDLDQYMGNAWGMMRAGEEAIEEVVLLFDANAGRWVAEEQWHKSQQVEQLADGSVLFRVRIPITPEFMNWVMYYGAKVKVLQPQHLREKIIEEHQRAALRNREE